MNENNVSERRRLLFSPVDCESSEIGVALASLADSRDRTLRALQEIQQNELNWAPPQNVNTIGTLLYHMAAIEIDWLYCEILVQEFPADLEQWFPHDVRDSESQRLSAAGDSIQEHSARLLFARNRLVSVLSTMSQTEYLRIRPLEAYDVTPQWIVHHLLQHEASHRGQIVMLRNQFQETLA